MSRVIVKNLPEKCSEELVKQMFSSLGEVTDVKLVKTKGGTFRKFGFIGFKKEEQACAAIKHYNKTYIGSCKIEVEQAKPYGDQSLNRPWSKYSSGSSAHQQREGNREAPKEEGKEGIIQKTKVSQLLEDYENLEEDPSFQEFLDIHKHKEKVKTWLDSTVVPGDRGCAKGRSLSKTVQDDRLNESCSNEDSEDGTEGDSEGRREDMATATGTSDLDYLKTKVIGIGLGAESHNTSLKSSDTCSNLSSSESEGSNHVEASALDHEETTPATTPYTIKMLGLPFNAKQKDIQVFFHPLLVMAVRFTKDSLDRPSGRGYVDFQSEEDLKEALKRNKDCIRHRYIELFRDDPTHRKQEEVREDVQLKPWELKELARSSEVESIVESGRIFVRNLPFSTQEDDLNELFAEYGPLTEITIPLDKTTNKTTGMGFVTFMLPEHAVKAFQALDNQIFQGRLLHLLPARPKTAPPSTTVISHQQHSSYKKKKETKVKSEAGGGHNWNSLFLGANAVLDVMAEKYGTDKSVILDPGASGGGGSAAVRMALGETEVVRETREFLLHHGVNLEAFEQGRPKRSKTTIMVKNLPSKTKDTEIFKLFQSFGQLVKVILPPAGISAMVDFAEPSHARQAFSKLAYTSFKHMPLYLEWAPVNALGDSSACNVLGKKTEVQSKEEMEEGEDAKTGTVFVKNLNFSTNEDSLCKMFSEVGAVKSATVARKRNPKDPSTPLSMGYGFVEYESKDIAMEALKTLQKKVLDGHTLELKFSHHKNSATSRVPRKTSTKKHTKSSKILVRNVPFEASNKEIQDLFCTFGALKTVRLPKKLLGNAGSSGEHRGFGFVEFVSKEDALRAFESLSHSTHLYGRRLVLEWAKQEESLEAIRKRTAEHFHGFTLPWDKRRKGQQQSLLNTLENNQ